MTASGKTDTIFASVRSEGGGTGRHARLRISCHRRGGSSPPSRTTEKNSSSAIFHSSFPTQGVLMILSSPVFPVRGPGPLTGNGDPLDTLDLMPSCSTRSSTRCMHVIYCRDTFVSLHHLSSYLLTPSTRWFAISVSINHKQEIVLPFPEIPSINAIEKDAPRSPGPYVPSKNSLL